MNRFKMSWAMFSTSLAVLRNHKKLLLFPMLTAVFTLFLALFFLVPIALQPTGHRYSEKAHWKSVALTMFTADSLERVAGEKVKPGERRQEELVLNRRGLAIVALIYFVSMFFATFFNVAFYSQIYNALGGKEVSFSGGLSFALSRSQSILIWSLFVGIVGFLIQKLEQKVGFVGKIVIGMIGIAWSVASVFAVPVLVCQPEVSNPLEMLRRSAGALKKTWGESLIGYAGLQFGGLIAILGFIGLMAGGTFLGSHFNNAWFLLSIPLALLMLFAYAYLISVAGHVYKCALYAYAASGTPPAGYTPEMMHLAWKLKK